MHFDQLAEIVVETKPDEHGAISVHLQLCPPAELFCVLESQWVEFQKSRELVDDLVGRVLDIEPKGLASLNELCYQRPGWVPHQLAAIVNPGPHATSPGLCQCRSRQLDTADLAIGWEKIASDHSNLVSLVEHDVNSRF